MKGLLLMMSQEEYVDVVALHRQGWAIVDIAEAVGRHPETVSNWIRRGGPPVRREVTGTLLGDRWGTRVGELLQANPRLSARSVFRLLAAEGCQASYPTLTRHLRVVRGPKRGRRTPTPTVAIETPAGEEAQADWSELSGEDCAALGIEAPVYCFGCVLCWSRWRFWWFADSLDFSHTAHAMALSFADFGGVPAKVRIDNMGALVARAHPRLVLRSPARLFANSYGFTVAGCWPGDGQRKGKVERPFRELKESFVQEMALNPPAAVGELNRRVGPWLDAVVHARPHRTTGERPADRRRREAPLLAPLPAVAFDTARREPRRVPPTCLVEVDGVRYSTPPQVIGELVEIRIATVADRRTGRLQIRAAGRLVAEHPVAAEPGSEVWDGAHRAAVETAARSRHAGRRHLSVVDGVRPAPVAPASPEVVALPDGDFDVAPIDLAARLRSVDGDDGRCGA